jgi:peroxin-11B
MSNAKRLQREAYRAWFVGLACNTIAGLYTLWQLRQREQSIDKKDGESLVESKKLQRLVSEYQQQDSLAYRNRERTATNIQLISDLCDLTVPSSALGYANFDDGIVGLAGTVSSLIGAWGAWKKTA